LRKLEKLPYSGGKIRAEWWTEQFDAVVVATFQFDSTHVPRIENLDSWARAFPDQVYHSRDYREPERLRGKNVLIVGGSISAAGIARDLSPYVRSFSISARHQDTLSFRRRWALRSAPANLTWIPEIRSFSKINLASHARGLQSALITLANGTTVGNFDEIIFATGFRRSNPFLADYHNSTIIGTEEPEVKVAPIITDGTHIRSLHWTGHYINDPTLAITGGTSFILVRYQALAFAKVWSGKAKLPNEARMWEEYPGAKRMSQIEPFGTPGQQALTRLFITWLNNASLEFGGRLISPWPIENREQMVYFADKVLEPGYTSSANFVEYENMPRDAWGTLPPTLKEGSGDYWADEDW